MSSRLALVVAMCLVACADEAEVESHRAAASAAWATSVSGLCDAAELFLEEERGVRTTECTISDVECQEMRAQSRVANRLAALVTSELAEHRFAASEDGDTAWRGLVDRLSTSDRLSERLALLTIMLRVERLPRKTVPDAIVVLEPEQSPAETMLWLELLARADSNPSSSTGQRIEQLVCDSRLSVGFRGLAFAALGHEHLADQLQASVACVQGAEPIDRFWTNRFGNSLGRCGSRCFDTILRLASSSVMWERQAGLQAATMLGPSQQDMVAASLDRDSLESWEWAFVDRAVGRVER